MRAPAKEQLTVFVEGEELPGFIIYGLGSPGLIDRDAPPAIWEGQQLARTPPNSPELNATRAATGQLLSPALDQGEGGQGLANGRFVGGEREVGRGAADHVRVASGDHQQLQVPQRRS
jgi:hypothetical protein